MSAQRRIGLVTLAALLAACALHVAGRGSLTSPPFDSWTALDAWYVRTSPAVAAVAVVRVVALGAAGWLVAAGGLQLLAGVLTSERFSAAVDAVSPRFLRVLAGSAASLSITAGLAVPAQLSGAAGNPPGTAVMVPLDPPGSSSTSTTPTTTAPTTSSTSTLPPTTTVAPMTPTTTTTDTSPLASPDPPASPTAAASVARGGEVVVARGDSFWSIAVDEAGSREVVGYWRTLIDANRDRLVDRENPDLLYPGQVLRLP